MEVSQQKAQRLDLLAGLLRCPMGMLSLTRAAEPSLCAPCGQLTTCIIVSILADRRDAVPRDPHPPVPSHHDCKGLQDGCQVSCCSRPCGPIHVGTGLVCGLCGADLAGDRMNWARTPQEEGSEDSSLISVRQQEIGFWCPDTSSWNGRPRKHRPLSQRSHPPPSSPMASGRTQPGPANVPSQGFDPGGRCWSRARAAVPSRPRFHTGCRFSGALSCRRAFPLTCFPMCFSTSFGKISSSLRSQKVERCAP